MDYTYFHSKVFNKVKDNYCRNIQKMAQLDICDVIRLISDDKAFALFNTIALDADNTSIAMSRLKLTRKQYYSRMSALTNAHLITRKNGKYFLTSFGKVVYEAHTLIGRAQQNYWKLKAIDAIEYSDNALKPEERDGFINSLIEDNNLKQILLSFTKKQNKELIALPHQTLELARYTPQNINF
jgi:hypothetical protein